MKPQLVLDHLALLARTLEEGVAYINDALGIDIPKGGQHPDMGTHNHLMALGPDTYIEVITIDPAAGHPGRPRWFGLDDFDGEPCLGTWIAGTPDIEASKAASPVDVGSVLHLSRGTLSWKISVADDGSLPLGGAFPSLIEWPAGGTHPASRMTDLGCRLTNLQVQSPDAFLIADYLDGALDDDKIHIVQGPHKISAVFDTPNGERVLV